jgi:hypothetical protein
MIRTITYNPGMQITNVDQLSKGTGAKYLEVLDNNEGPFIAVQWRKTKPKSLQPKHKLVEFPRKLK